MSNSNEYIDDFKVNYKKFEIGCDAIESEGRWPLKEYGEMDVYFKNDFACVIIRLIAADGKVVKEELDFLNDVLGFDYTVKELEELYQKDGDKIRVFFESELGKSLNMIRNLNEELAESYRSLLKMIAKIVIGSDGVITEEEKAAAEKLIEALE